MENWPSPEHKAPICIYIYTHPMWLFLFLYKSVTNPAKKTDRRHLIPIIRDIILP